MVSFARKIVILIFFLTLGLNLMAQDSCSLALDSAKNLFNSGQIEEIPDLLSPCIAKGLSQQEEIQAYLLLVQVYLFDSDMDKAEKTMTEFLGKYPAYKPRPADPAEFVELFKTFRVRPTWGIGINVSPGLADVYVKEKYTTDNFSTLNSKYHPNKLGFGSELQVSRYFGKYFWVAANFQFSTLSLKRTDMLGGNSEELNFTEKTSWFSVPLTLNVSIGKGKWAPYFFAGGEMGYLLSDRTTIVRHNNADSSIPNVTQGTTGNLSNRERNSICALGGVGVQYKILGGYFNFSIGYKYSLKPFVKQGNRYADNNMLYYYQYLDDDFRINRYYCSFGFTTLFYRIKK